MSRVRIKKKSVPTEPESVEMCFEGGEVRDHEPRIELRLQSASRS